MPHYKKPVYGKSLRIWSTTSKKNGELKKHSKTKISDVLFQGKYTRDEIIKEATKMNKGLIKDGFKGRYSIALLYPEGWKAGYFVNVKEKPDLFHYSDSADDREDPEHYSRFVIYYQAIPTKGGCKGNSEYNDCLYEVLVKIVGEDNVPWKNPKELKDFLGLKRKDKIDVKFIPKIEEKMEKYAITLQGDHNYFSTKDPKNGLKIFIRNGHYQVGQKLNKAKVCREDKLPLIFERVRNIDKEDQEEVRVYGKKTQDEEPKAMILTAEKFSLCKKAGSPYIVVPVDKTYTGKDRLKKTYDEFIQNAEELLKKTNGAINLYRSGSKAKTALDYFFKLGAKNRIPDQIHEDEAFWLYKTNHGPIIWTDQYEGEPYKYDISSEYPSIMVDDKMMFPIYRGEFKKITQKEFSKAKFLEYGIYRIDIEKSIDEKVKKMFRYNKDNYYTHIDHARALKLKLTMRIIESDDNPNALVYSNDKLVKGNDLFGKFVEVMFDLKKQKVAGAKGILNSLWGALCQTKKWKITCRKGDDVNLALDAEITGIIPVTKEKVLLEYYQQGSIFETDYARIKPFILAKGRETIVAYIEKHFDVVKRVHTDSMITTQELNIKLGNDLGDMKYEGYCESVLLKSGKAIGQFVL